MAFDELVLQEFQKYSIMNNEQIMAKLHEISKREYEQWLNNEIFFSRIRDLHIWRFSQFMVHIWQFKVPTYESVAFIFQVTLTSARSLIKDYKAQYGRKGYNQSLQRNIVGILRKFIQGKKGSIEVPFQTTSQIEELFESVRRISSSDPSIAEPKKVQGRTYVVDIEIATAKKVIEELKEQNEIK